MVSDTRNARDMRMIYWAAAPMVRDVAMRQLLDKYLVIGVGRGHGSPAGTISFDNIETLQVLDAEAKPLRRLSTDEIPPAVNGAVMVLISSFSQSLGAFGKGFRWFVFDTGSVHACNAGKVSVPFADEVYTYETPIPGCPAT